MKVLAVVIWIVLSLLSGAAFLVALVSLLRSRHKRGIYYLIFFLACNGVYSIVFSIVSLLSIVWNQDYLPILIIIWGIFYLLQTASGVTLAWYLSGLIDEIWIYKILGRLGISTDE